MKKRWFLLLGLCLLVVIGCDSRSEPEVGGLQEIPTPAPSSALLIDQTAGDAPLDVVFRIAAPDPARIVQIELDFEGDGTFDAFHTSVAEVNEDGLRYTYTEAGRYFPRLRLGDTSGEISETSAEIVVSQMGNQPPSVLLSADSEEGTAPLSVGFQAQASDAEGDIRSYEWDFDGDGVFDLNTAELGSTNHIYLNGGLQQATVQVTDGAGLTARSSLLVKVTREGNLPPTARLDADKRTGDPVPVEITLDASASSDPEGPLKLYEWDLDGNGSYDEKTTEPKLTYACSFKGETRPRVRVTDADGATAESDLQGDPIFLNRGWTVSTVRTYGLSQNFPTDIVLEQQRVSTNFFVVGAFIEGPGDPKAGFFRADIATPTDLRIRTALGLSGNHSRPRIAVVQGFPFITFLTGGVGSRPAGLFSARAREITGLADSWTTPELVEEGKIQSYSLAVVQQNPAVAIAKFDEGTFYLRRGDSGFFSERWSRTTGFLRQRVVSAIDLTPGTPALALINGKPALAFSASKKINLGLIQTSRGSTRFATAGTEDGSGTWNPDTEVEDSTLEGFVLREIAGKPAILNRPDHGIIGSNSNRGCRFERARSFTGGWQEGENKSFGVGQYARNMVLDVSENRPWVVFDAAGSIRAARAADAVGSSWPTLERVETSPGTIHSMGMIAMKGKIIVVYSEDIPHPTFFFINGQIVGRALKVAVWD